MTRYRPVPSLDPAGRPGSLPLAGSALIRFHEAEVTARGRAPAFLAAADLPSRAAARLSDLRAPLMGLTLDRPRVMGILNVTPDSFSDGGLYHDFDAAVTHATALVDAGAEILDIGGESTRPGADDVPVPEEIRRTAPVIRALRDRGITAPVSIDTRKAEVARAALAAGADMVNDVSALTHDPDMAAFVAESGVPVCLMHAQGTPRTMQANPRYDDVLAEVFDWLAERIAAARAAGIAADRILADPGIGFGKTIDHNLTLLRGLSLLHDLGCALLLGASRKRFIGTIGGGGDGAGRMPGSVAVALHAAAQGAQIIRVHDVAETVQALRLWQALGPAPTTAQDRKEVAA